MNDSIFTAVNIDDFKEACDSVLNKLKIILTKPLLKIDNESEKQRLISKYHNDPLVGGHVGRNKLIAKLKERYIWKNLSKDVARAVKNCTKCIQNKVRSATREPMKLTPTPQSSFDIVIIDTIGPLQKSDSGNQYAVTMICDLTKYLVTAPIPDKSAKSVARAIFEKLILIYGPMKSLRSDKGTEYENSVLAELSHLMNIEQKITTAYHHQSVGSIERNHRTFNEYIRSFVENMSTWDTYLRYFTFLYNITKSSCFKNRYSPYELVFGKLANSMEFLENEIQPLYNIDNYAREIKYRLQVANKRAIELLDVMKKKNKYYYDKKINPIE